ncbi:MAG: hypothetical protein QOH12_2355 [Solirubrobacteraceae bacterium]|nr:hypothetical protein [Solirubrobacteraceae bacterium]
MAGGREALRRLHWRRRGAWLWPMYAAAVAGDGVLLHLLPISGARTPLVGGLLLAGVLNLLVVAGLSPAAGSLIRRRRGDLPVVVARDYAGRGLIVLLGGCLALLGIDNIGRADAERGSLREQAFAVHAYVETQAPAAYRGHMDRARTRVLDAHLFRTCVPGGKGGPWLCVFVDTTQQPPGVSLDPSRVPD